MTTRKPKMLTKMLTCPDCEGRGVLTECGEWEPCSTCDGDGVLELCPAAELLIEIIGDLRQALLDDVPRKTIIEIIDRTTEVV